MKRSVLSVLILTIPFLTMAQENNFLLYSMKGNVSVIENKVESKAKIGKVLTGSSVIKVGTGSFATLICNEAAMFTVSKAGTYTLTQFKDSCEVHNTSFTANYLKYVWNQMTTSHGSPGSNRKAFMNTIGAVSRSVNNIWVDPRLDTVYYTSGTVPLSWKSYAEADKFEFKLFDQEMSEKAIFSKTTDKKHVDLSELLKTIQPGKSYWWTAMVKGENNDERKYLRYWTKEDYTAFYNKILSEESASESDAEKNFRLGFVLEENHFLAEAYQHYLKATELAPDVPLYRFTFMSFKKDYEIK